MVMSGCVCGGPVWDPTDRLAAFEVVTYHGSHILVLLMVFTEVAHSITGHFCFL